MTNGKEKDAGSTGDSDRVASLTALGLSEIEASVYLATARRRATLAELASSVGAGRAAVSQALESLVRDGLLVRQPGRPPSFDIVTPELTLPGLLRSREQELDMTRQVIREVVRELASRQGLAAGEYVELVIGVEATGAQFEKLQAVAQSEILGFTKLPLLVTSPATGNPGETRALERGVASRWVYESAALEIQGMLEDMQEFASRGEDIRVAPSLPAKLVLVDRAVALFHVTEHRPDGSVVGGLVMRHPEVVSALHSLFEAVWDRSLPLFEAGTPGNAEREELIQSLIAGLTDDAIARRSGCSRRTVVRRVQELFSELGVETRFQAGFRLAMERGEATSRMPRS